MKSSILLNGERLFLYSKGNRVVRIDGRSFFKSEVLNHFNAPVTILKPCQNDVVEVDGVVLQIDGVETATLTPGSNDYIVSVLIEKIQNELGALINYNI